MKAWQQQCQSLFEPGLSTKDIWRRIEVLTQAMNFEYAVYVLEGLLPVSAPRSYAENNLPDHLRARLRAMRLTHVLPMQRHARVSARTAIWPMKAEDEKDRDFWRVMRGMGFTAGATMPAPRRGTAIARLTLVRTHGDISETERLANQAKWEYLSYAVDTALRPRFEDHIVAPTEARLSDIEQKVLSRAADGMTAEQTSRSVGESTRMVEYYRKRAQIKLGAKTLTEAAVTAALLGLFHEPVQVINPLRVA